MYKLGNVNVNLFAFCLFPIPLLCISCFLRAYSWVLNHQYLVTQTRGLWLGSLEPRFSPSSFYHPFPYAFGARVMSFSPRQSVCWIITDKLLYVLGSPWCSSTAYTNTVLISSNHQRNKKDTKCRRSWELPHSDRRVLVQVFCLFLLFCDYEVT